MVLLPAFVKPNWPSACYAREEKVRVWRTLDSLLVGCLACHLETLVVKLLPLKISVVSMENIAY
jgi:hypothetical protein